MTTFPAPERRKWRSSGGILTTAEVGRALESRPGWHRDERGLVRQLQLRDFASARGFAEELADAATYYGHRPDIAVRDDGRLVVSVANRNHAGVTVGELALADRIDGAIERSAAAGTIWDVRA